MPMHDRQGAYFQAVLIQAQVLLVLVGHVHHRPVPEPQPVAGAYLRG